MTRSWSNTPPRFACRACISSYMEYFVLYGVFRLIWSIRFIWSIRRICRICFICSIRLIWSIRFIWSIRCICSKAMICPIVFNAVWWWCDIVCMMMWHIRCICSKAMICPIVFNANVYVVKRWYLCKCRCSNVYVVMQMYM